MSPVAKTSTDARLSYCTPATAVRTTTQRLFRRQGRRRTRHERETQAVRQRLNKRGRRPDARRARGRGTTASPCVRDASQDHGSAPCPSFVGVLGRARECSGRTYSDTRPLTNSRARCHHLRAALGLAAAICGADARLRDPSSPGNSSSTSRDGPRLLETRVKNVSL